MAPSKRTYTGALWVGPHRELFDGTPLVPGETVVGPGVIGEPEATENEHWQPQYRKAGS